MDTKKENNSTSILFDQGGFGAQAKHMVEDHGLSVIPVKGPAYKNGDDEKKPLLASWAPYQDRKPTREEIEGWGRQWPKANVGIVTGPVSGLLVLDADTKEAHEWLQEQLPENMLTPMVRTPRGGWHVYLAYPEDSGLTIGADVHPTIKGLDMRGKGGYVVAPPSRGYSWIIGPEEAAATPPSALDNSFQRFCIFFMWGDTHTPKCYSRLLYSGAQG